MPAHWDGARSTLLISTHAGKGALNQERCFTSVQAFHNQVVLAVTFKPHGTQPMGASVQILTSWGWLGHHDSEVSRM